MQVFAPASTCDLSTARVVLQAKCAAEQYMSVARLNTTNTKVLDLLALLDVC
jgi:hypothetical protein